MVGLVLDALAVSQRPIVLGNPAGRKDTGSRNLHIRHGELHTQTSEPQLFLIASCLLPSVQTGVFHLLCALCSF